MRFGEAFPDDPDGECLNPVDGLLGDAALHQWFIRICDVPRDAWDRLEALCLDVSHTLLERSGAWLSAEVEAPNLLLGLAQLLSMLPDDQGRLADELLENLAEHGLRSRSLVKSLFAERQLRIPAWADLLNCLGKGGSSLEEDVRGWGERNRYAGAIARPPMPVGRVVEKNSFVTSLMTHAKLPRQVSRDTLADLKSITQWEEARDRCNRRGFRLGGDPMWATFDKRGNDPFHFAAGAPQRGKYIRACLGLERSPLPQRGYLPILLLRYLVHGDCFVPTTADAANYSEWNLYFAPAVVNGYGAHHKRGCSGGVIGGGASVSG